VVSDALPDFFDQFGWRYERRHPGEFLTGFSGDHGSWDIVVRVTDLVVTFTIVPYVERPADTAPGAGLLHVLLRANHDLNLAKLGIDRSHEVCLSVEMPADGFGYSQFADALMAIAHYADELKDRFDVAIAADADDLATRQGIM
jgi:hypothetical protein